MFLCLFVFIYISVVGANGSGKSAIVCAICLVLGGEPEVGDIMESFAPIIFSLLTIIEHNYLVFIFFTFQVFFNHSNFGFDQTLKRANRIVDFIKHSYNEGYIRIEIKGGNERDNLSNPSITRHIQKRSKKISIFEIDGQ